jgi:hypothetical protein
MGGKIVFEKDVVYAVNSLLLMEGKPPTIPSPPLPNDLLKNASS